MLVKNYDEMKPFIPTMVMKGSPDLFNDALDVAQDDLTAAILGSDLEEQLEGRAEADSRLLKLSQRAIAIQAFLTSIPELDLILTDSGFAVINNESLTMASKERVQSLTNSMQLKLDDSKDKLITYLMDSGLYDDWRGTEQFGRLSDGLIMTYADFKDVAVSNNITRPNYPKTWNEFLQLNSALNVALMTIVAKYISKEYAEAIIEKVRDKETFLPSELHLLKLVKIAIAAIALGDEATGINNAIKAENYMKANIKDFTIYANSDVYKTDLTLGHKQGPIYFMM